MFGPGQAGAGDDDRTALALARRVRPARAERPGAVLLLKGLLLMGALCSVARQDLARWK